jgi:hypothetical protein
LTNDSWPLIRALANGRACPVLFMDRYSKGILYIWTIPDNFNDLYRLPQEVTSALKSYLLRGFPVRVDGPAQVALFPYDNDTFIVESYLPEKSSVKISIAGESAKLRNLGTGEMLTGHPAAQRFERRRGSDAPQMEFSAQLAPHSYAVFAVEK